MTPFKIYKMARNCLVRVTCAFFFFYLPTFERIVVAKVNLLELNGYASFIDVKKEKISGLMRGRMRIKSFNSFDSVS